MKGTRTHPAPRHGSHALASWWWPTVLLTLCFFGGALLFCTSMLSTSTVLSTTATEACTGLRPIGQVVVVLIDAVRPDFVLSSLRPYARHGGGCVRPPDTEGAEEAHKPYAGPTLTYMEDALKNAEDASQGFFLVADAPTTTAQRIKAIATGTMPAFLEAGSNFNSDATEIDSVVRQMGGRAVLLGDDTWVKLFPNDDPASEVEAAGGATPQRRRRHWKYTVAIPSFDVADFHTNDDAVLNAVFNVLTREVPEAADTSAGEEPYAQLIVAHFLGVDHVGHRINSDNKVMDSKLAQLNVMLRNVSQTLRSRETVMDTMLLVLGDHGMTNSGDHGGDSAQETDTFLFAQRFRGSLTLPPRRRTAEHFSEESTWAGPAKRAVVDALAEQRQADKADEELVRLEACRAASGVAATKLGAAYQVDVTPTISTLLGKPIPFSSFGRVVPEILALADEQANVSEVEKCNLAQMERYFVAAEVTVPAQTFTPPELAGVSGGPEQVAARRRAIAKLSYFARRTRTDMHRNGMFVGACVLLTAALLLLCLPSVQECFAPGRVIGNWTVVIVVLRLCIVFSNSFIVNEDVEVCGLLVALLAIPLLRGFVSQHPSVAARQQRAQRTFHWRLMAAAVVSMRVVAPLVLRHRAHITHTVEDASQLDLIIAQWPSVWKPERIGIVTGCAFACFLYVRESVIDTIWCLLAGALLCATYHVPVAHHLSPLAVAVAHYFCYCRVWVQRCALDANSQQCQPKPQRMRPRMFMYIVWVLWASSLCNEKCVAAVVMALYGVCLPALATAIRALPPTTQAAILHIGAYAVFFMEGHQCMLNTIDWNSSFVGVPQYSMLGGGILVLTRTFNTFLFTPVACALAGADDTRHSANACANSTLAKAGDTLSHRVDREAVDDSGVSSDRHYSSGLRRQDRLVRHLFVHLAVAQGAISCFSGYIQKRHLMLYPIFCPKLLFDVVICLLTGAGFIVSIGV